MDIYKTTIWRICSGTQGGDTRLSQNFQIKGALSLQMAAHDLQYKQRFA